MKLSEGVEWAAHACAVLAALPPGRVLSAAALADFSELPPQYMAKHLQALARAKLVVSSRGAGGGYRLARPAAEISLWDVTAAIEGAARGFRCQEIRRKGPCSTPAKACREPCAIAAAFWAAEEAYRAVLKSVSVGAINTEIRDGMGAARRETFRAWMADMVGVQRL